MLPFLKMIGVLVSFLKPSRFACGMIPRERLQVMKKRIEQAKNPLFLFDDDADGVSSFLLCYDFVKRGYGVVVNTTPHLTMEHLHYVERYKPDLVVILDLAEVDQEFIDACSCEVLWLDHHQPLERQNVVYENPMLHEPKDNRPVTYWCYQMLGGKIWVAALGSVGDWYMHTFLHEFRKEFPDLLEVELKTP